jgi:hypothetical protein
MRGILFSSFVFVAISVSLPLAFKVTPLLPLAVGAAMMYERARGENR